MELKESFVLNQVKFSQNVPFYGSAIKLEEFASHALKTLKEIEKTDNVRVIVLETWLIIDYCIRELLISGLDLNKVNLDSYDLRDKLLPISFVRCVEILEGFKKAHKDLPRDPEEKGIRLSTEFLFFVNKQYPDFFAKLLEVERKYYEQYAPELIKDKNIFFEQIHIRPAKVEYSRINKHWLDVASQIDQSWINSVKQLNSARNYAAHSYDSEKIAKEMGYSGPNASTLLKAKCLELLQKLIGITIALEDGSESQNK